MAATEEPTYPLPVIERVYFVGAGFSAGAGYPLGSSLLFRLIDWLRKKRFRKPSTRDQAARILALTESLLGRYLAVAVDLQAASKRELRAAFQNVNVAEFFSVAHALADTPLLFGTPTRARRERSNANSVGGLSSLYELLAAATRTFFCELSYQAKIWPDDMGEMIDTVKVNTHAIVNFNWDEEVDILLTVWRGNKQDVAYTLRGWRKNTKYVHLKPHGSMSWYDVKQGIGNPDVYFVAEDDHAIPRAQRQLVSYTENDLPLDIDGQWHDPLGCPPVISPPTFAKRFVYREQQQIWQDVIQVCRTAREFVFLGYSLPPDDFLTRAAIRAALAENRGRRRLRCLVVARSANPTLVSQFASVFPGFDAQRNVWPWTFGKKPPRRKPGEPKRRSAGTLLNQRLAQATLR